MYKITKYTKDKAKKLGFDVVLSKSKGKKIDIFKDGKKIASVGALGYNDYPTYLEKEKKGLYPKGYANQRRKLYKIRHQKDRGKKGTESWFADQLLW
jgi:hypothetical protein